MALSLGTALGRAYGTGAQTLSITPSNIGDCVVFVTTINSITITSTALSSTNVTWNSSASIIDTSDSVNTLQLWIGKATAASAATVTPTWSGTITSAYIEVVSMGVHSSVACNWQIVPGQSGGTFGTTTTNPQTISLATLTSSTGDLGEFYFGYMTSGNTAAIGSTAGFTYSADANGNLQLYNLALAASTGYTPNAVNTFAATYDTVAYIVQAVNLPIGKERIVSQAVQRASFR